MKYRILVLTAILFTACNLLHAQVQTGKLSGIIIDANNEETLVGANIYVESLKKGTSTDKNGEFSIEVPAGHYRIVISYMGYRTRQEEVRISELKTKKVVIRLEPETQSLGEVVVTAKSEARQLREQAMPMSVISMQQLQGTVSNVQDVLSKTVGVTIRNTGGVGSSSRVSVRGLEGKRIGFFIDGSPMNDNSDFIDINDIPVDMIDRIEIYKGVVPARFGGSSVGGAVNIVIREYPPKYLDASYSIESFNTHKLSLVTKRNIATKGLEFGGGGFYTYSDNNYKMESPFEEGLIIKRNHDKFKKLAVAGSLKARKWWFDLAEFEPVFIHTFKEIQGIEYNIEKALLRRLHFRQQTGKRKLPDRRARYGIESGLCLHGIPHGGYRCLPIQLGRYDLSCCIRIWRRDRQMGLECQKRETHHHPQVASELCDQ